MEEPSSPRDWIQAPKRGASTEGGESPRQPKHHNAHAGPTSLLQGPSSVRS